MTGNRSSRTIAHDGVAISRILGTVRSFRGIPTSGFALLGMTKNFNKRAAFRRPFDIYFPFSSSGMKSRVMDWMPVRSWVYLTPAESSMRLEARVDMESAYLSER